MTKVTEIIEQKSGTGAKGVWIRTNIKTDDGKFASTFDDVQIGDEVELTYNEQYKNWKASKPRAAASGPVANNEGALRAIYAKLNIMHADLKRLMGEADTPEPDYSEPEPEGPPPPPAGNPALRAGLAKNPGTMQPDTVHDVLGDEPINLDDIPF